MTRLRYYLLRGVLDAGVYLIALWRCRDAVLLGVFCALAATGTWWPLSLAAPAALAAVAVGLAAGHDPEIRMRITERVAAVAGNLIVTAWAVPILPGAWKLAILATLTEAVWDTRHVVLALRWARWPLPERLRDIT